MGAEKITKISAIKKDLGKFAISHEGNFIFYKFLIEDLKSPYENFSYKEGEWYESEVDMDKNKKYGYGLNIGTLEWIIRTVKEDFSFDHTILAEALVPTYNLKYVIPKATKSKIRPPLTIPHTKIVIVPRSIKGIIRVSKMKLNRLIEWKDVFHTPLCFAKDRLYPEEETSHCHVCLKPVINDLEHRSGDWITYLCSDECRNEYIREKNEEIKKEIEFWRNFYADAPDKDEKCFQCEIILPQEKMRHYQGKYFCNNCYDVYCD